MILHQFLPFFLVVYAEFFQQVVERLVYGVILSHAKSHLLYRVQQHLDFSMLEQVCAAYHHTEGSGTHPTHTVPDFYAHCSSNICTIFLCVNWKCASRSVPICWLVGSRGISYLTTCPITALYNALKSGWRNIKSGPALRKFCNKSKQTIPMNVPRRKSAIRTPCTHRLPANISTP